MPLITPMRRQRQNGEWYRHRIMPAKHGQDNGYRCVDGPIKSLNDGMIDNRLKGNFRYNCGSHGHGQKQRWYRELRNRSLSGALSGIRN